MWIKQVKSLKDEGVNEIYALLLKAYPTSLLSYLIYSDLNYPFYLKKIMNDYRDNIFFIAEENDQLAGFAHFKIIGKDLFLNNIVIEPSQRGGGAGKSLLSISIDRIKKMFDPETFSLDVFSKNSKAFDWYKRMGMKTMSKTHWYDVASVFKGKKFNEKGSNDIKKEEDNNGFRGLYKGKTKIASIIGKDTLIFRDLELMYRLGKNEGDKFKNFCLINQKELSFNSIEISNRLTMNVGDLDL